MDPRRLPREARLLRLAVALASVLDDLLDLDQSAIDGIVVAMVKQKERDDRALSLRLGLLRGDVPPAILLSPGGET